MSGKAADAAFTPRYDDKTVDVRHLESVPLISSYWAGEAMAHLLVSFGVGERDYVVIPIETRKERTEATKVSYG